MQWRANFQLDLKVWADKHGLLPETMDLLSKDGFTSLQAVSLLTDSIIKDYKGSMNLAQFLLLRDAIQQLKKVKEGNEDRNASPTVPPPSDSASRQGRPTQAIEESSATQHNTPDALQSEGGLGMAALIDLLGGQRTQDQPSQSSLTSPITGKAAIFDPLFIKKQACKHRDIRDYISLSEPRSEKPHQISVNNVSVSLSEGKVPLEKVTPLQYTEASLMILREMVATDNLTQEEIMQYVAYVIKVSCLGQQFTWQSVLTYDTHYRKAQAMLGFHWGADNSYLMQLHLKPRQELSGPHFKGLKIIPDMILHQELWSVNALMAEMGVI